VGEGRDSECKESERKVRKRRIECEVVRKGKRSKERSREGKGRGREQRG